MTERRLYGRETCPYSAKVRSKLDELGLEHEEVTVPDQHKDRTEVRERTGQTSVPILVDPALDEEWIDDSREIVAFLERTYAE